MEVRGETTVDIDLDEVANRIGEEYILGDQVSEQGYLAALALETMEDDDYDIERTLIEFIENTSEPDLDRSEREEIVEILRGR